MTPRKLLGNPAPEPPDHWILKLRLTLKAWRFSGQALVSLQGQPFGLLFLHVSFAGEPKKCFLSVTCPPIHSIFLVKVCKLLNKLAFLVWGKKEFLLFHGETLLKQINRPVLPGEMKNSTIRKTLICLPEYIDAWHILLMVRERAPRHVKRPN